MGLESMFGFGEQAPPGSQVSHESFCQRMGHAICGVFLGIFLFLGGLYFTYWNEGRAVHESCAIFQASSTFDEASCTKSTNFDNTLVHLGCKIDQNTSVQNWKYPQLNISTEGMIFKGTLQQYQIHESSSTKTTKNAVGGGTTKVTTYSYDYRWSSSAAPAFHNPNAETQSPGKNPHFPSISLLGGTVSPINLGTGYHLNDEMVPSAAGPAQTVPTMGLPKFQSQNTWDKDKGTGTAPMTILKNCLNTGKNGTCNFRYADGEFVTAATPTPKVGDLKIKYTVAQPVTDFTVMGKQLSDGSFSKESFAKCANYGFLKYSAGTVSADDLINQANESNKFMTYLLRFAAFMALWCGLQLCVGPVALVPDLIPCIGPYIGDLVGCMLMCATCLVATFFFCIVFALSWIYFRPMIGIPMFVVACLAGGGLIYWRVSKKKAAESEETYEKM